MLLSIIITAYNSKATIKKCLDSILSCEADNFEVLVIDDCPKEPVKNEIDSYADSRVRYFHNEYNLGCGLSRNVGLSYSRGEFVTFIDADDSYADGAIFTILNELDDFNFDILVFDYDVKYDNITEKRVWSPSEEGILKDFLADRLVSTAWNKVYKKSIVDENKLSFPSYQSQDSVFNFSFLLSSQDFKKINKSLYLFDKSGESITKSVYSSRSFVQVSSALSEMYRLADSCNSASSDISKYLALRKFLFLFKDPVLRLYRDWRSKCLDREVLRYCEREFKKTSFNEGFLFKSGMLGFRDWVSFKVFRFSPSLVFLVMRAMAVK